MHPILIIRFIKQIQYWIKKRFEIKRSKFGINCKMVFFITERIPDWVMIFREIYFINCSLFQKFSLSLKSACACCENYRFHTDFRIADNAARIEYLEKRNTAPIYVG